MLKYGVDLMSIIKKSLKPYICDECGKVIQTYSTYFRMRKELNISFKFHVLCAIRSKKITTFLKQKHEKAFCDIIMENNLRLFKGDKIGV